MLGDREPPVWPGSGLQILPPRRRRPRASGDRLTLILLLAVAAIGAVCMGVARAQMAGLLPS